MFSRGYRSTSKAEPEEVTMARITNETKKDTGKGKKASDPDTLTKSRKGAEIELTEAELKRVTGAAAKKT